MKLNDMPEFRDKKHVLSFDESDSVEAAVNKMADKNYGAVAVTKDGKLTGIFTERDVLRRVVANDLNIKKTALKDVMSTELKTARTDDLIADCLRRMSQGRFRHLPVVNESDEVIGMLSQGDFVAFTMSDIVNRVSRAAGASVQAGQSTPWSMLTAILVYTLAVLFLFSGMQHWL